LIKDSVTFVAGGIIRMKHPHNNRVAALVAAILAGSIASSQAADYLRGVFEPSPPASANAGVDWSGFYAGFLVGGSSAQVNPSANANTLATQAIPNHTATPYVASLIRFKDITSSKMSGGVFAGYNVLWDDVVLGFEADYSQAKFIAKSESSDIRLFTDSTDASRTYHTTIDSKGEAAIKNWMTLRGRVGWAAGNFMPYLTAGLALGNLRSDYSTTVTVKEYQTITQTSNCGTTCTTTQYVGTTGPNTGSIKHNGIAYGVAAGAGVDFAFSQKYFVRAEWQYVQFGADGKKPDITINTTRIAGAMRF
jgi:outer membrane immunogenic protein